MNAVLVSAFVSLLIGSVSAVITFWLNVKRDEKTAKRDLKVVFLLDAQRNLMGLANRGMEMEEDEKRVFETAISDIMLLGDEEQIQVVREVVEELRQGKRNDIDPIIISLRESLRNELNLAEVALPKAFVFRFCQ